MNSGLIENPLFTGFGGSGFFDRGSEKVGTELCVMSDGVMKGLDGAGWDGWDGLSSLNGDLLAVGVEDWTGFDKGWLNESLDEELRI